MSDKVIEMHKELKDFIENIEYPSNDNLKEKSEDEINQMGIELDTKINNFMDILLEKYGKEVFEQLDIIAMHPGGVIE